MRDTELSLIDLLDYVPVARCLSRALFDLGPPPARSRPSPVIRIQDILESLPEDARRRKPPATRKINRGRPRHSRNDPSAATGKTAPSSLSLGRTEPYKEGWWAPWAFAQTCTAAFDAIGPDIYRHTQLRVGPEGGDLVRGMSVKARSWIRSLKVIETSYYHDTTWFDEFLWSLDRLSEMFVFPSENRRRLQWESGEIKETDFALEEERKGPSRRLRLHPGSIPLSVAHISWLYPEAEQLRAVARAGHVRSFTAYGVLHPPPSNGDSPIENGIVDLGIQDANLPLVLPDRLLALPGIRRWYVRALGSLRKWHTAACQLPGSVLVYVPPEYADGLDKRVETFACPIERVLAAEVIFLWFEEGRAIVRRTNVNRASNRRQDGRALGYLNSYPLASEDEKWWKEVEITGEAWAELRRIEARIAV